LRYLWLPCAFAFSTGALQSCSTFFHAAYCVAEVADLTDTLRPPSVDATTPLNEDGVFTRPALILPNMALLPGVVTTLAVFGAHNRAAAKAADEAGESAILIPQVDNDAPLPTGVATEMGFRRLLQSPNEGMTALVQGRRRVEVLEYVQTEPYPIVRVRAYPAERDLTREMSAMAQAIGNRFRRLVELDETITDDVLYHILNLADVGLQADLAVSALNVSADERLRVLQLVDLEARLQHVAMLLGQELSMMELKDEIASQIQLEIDREQREVYLREQMRVIQSELGEEDFFQQEINDVREQIMAAGLSPEAHEKAIKELSRLALMSPIAPEVGMVRTYIDWLTSVPWTKATEDQLDIAHAQAILEAEHFGLPKVKDRILEFIAVRKLVPDPRSSPILCFVGPPGVGKTSLGKSIASALGREFARVSLGGVRDEAEIRGHRRTYVGALPGRIIQTMRRAGTINPVFMLDEIDKLGNDFRGDPSSALLEVLDPEQNNAFSDHYLDVPYDLSHVLFITTANDLDPLPPALLDRLEIIEFNSYTEEEKIAIARKFLIPRQLEAHGLAGQPMQFETAALQTLIREYTYEAGVRNLEREIANVCRKIARLMAEDKRHPTRINAAQVRRLLGIAPFDDEMRRNEQDEVGVAAGMAWTPVGGDLLIIEASIVAGKGNLTLTGSLGDVMQESAQAALSYVRARAEAFDIDPDDFDNLDIHIHLPEGSIPKEGPSAGITLAAAIISAFTERKVRSDIAMTGEITLRGKVLPVGGIKEKVLAARRAGIPHVIIPRQNERDLGDIPKDALKSLTVSLVTTMQEVLDLVLREGPAVGERRIDKLRQDREKDNDADDEGAEER
jgi:ATP-dependent Lon protease